MRVSGAQTLGASAAFAPRSDQLPAVRIEIAKTLEILEGFDGLPSLKKLQAHLNLDPENAPIPRRGWKEANRDLLAADPAIPIEQGTRSRDRRSAQSR